jgi:hypothetical protein
MRVTLRDRMRASPLCQGERFVKNLEAQYTRIWEAWCSGGGRCSGLLEDDGFKDKVSMRREDEGEDEEGLEEEEGERGQDRREAISPSGEAERTVNGGEGGRGPRDRERELSTGPEGASCED